MKVRTTVLSCVFFWQLAGLALSQIHGLEVADCLLSSALQDKMPLRPGIAPNAQVKEGPVYFWTMLAGNGDALNALINRNSKIWPTYHKWTFTGINGEEPDAPILMGDEAPEKLTNGAVSHTKGLQYEVEESGRFLWRTWTYKKYLQQGKYTVEVLFSDGTPVQQNGKPCVYTFVVVAR